MNLPSGEIRPWRELAFREPTGICFWLPSSAKRIIRPERAPNNKYFSSGDQEVGPSTVPPVRNWSLEASVTSTMWTPASLPPRRKKARRLPRGDHAGETSFRPNVTGEGDFRVMSVTQMLLPPEAPIRCTATNEPSGEICGLVPEASTGSASTGLPDLSNQINWPVANCPPV